MLKGLAIALAGLLCLLFGIIYSTLSESWKIKQSCMRLPWIGTDDKSLWSFIKYRLNNVFSLTNGFEDLNRKYWSNNKAVFAPLLTGDAIILPPTEFSWIASQPDDILDNHAQIIEEIQADLLLSDPYVSRVATHEKIITRDLTRQLANLTEDTFDELSASINDEWGLDAERWKELNPFLTLLDIVARVSNRIFVGKDLCRNPKLIKTAIDFAGTIIPVALLLRRFPQSLRPALVKVLGISNARCRRKIRDIFMPEIEARLREIDSSSDKEKPISKHNDFLQWTINAAVESGDRKELDPSIIVQRLIVVNFASIHTSSITLTNAIYNLVSAQNHAEIIKVLRDEISEALASTVDNKWTKHAVSSLVHVDSFLRESARITPLSALSMTRRVVIPGGITTPISNTFLPEGSAVAVPGLTIHRDPEIYEDPDVFKPFRFVDMRDHTSANLNMSTTSPQYVAFGHGRHACPGRFFASLELKLMLAYMVTNYDFEMVEKRPENTWAGSISVPPTNSTIKVRRRANV